MREGVRSKVSPGAEAVCFNASGEKQTEKSPELVKPTRGPLMHRHHDSSLFTLCLQRRRRRCRQRTGCSPLSLSV